MKIQQQGESAGELIEANQPWKYFQENGVFDGENLRKRCWTSSEQQTEKYLGHYQYDRLLSIHVESQ